ncbi:MAG: AI-2E family transporter [Anaerolineales bacterium]
MKSDSIETKNLWTTKQVVIATLFVVCVFLSLWLLFRFRVVVFLFFIAIVVGTTMRPAVEWLYRRGLTRPAGILVIYLAIATFLFGFLALIVPLIVDQTTQLTLNLPTYQSEFRKGLLNSGYLLLRNIGRSIPVNFIFLGNSNPSAEEVIDQVSQTFRYAGQVGRGILSILAVFLLAYYWTQESNFIFRSLLNLFPRNRRKDAREFIQLVEAKIGGYVRGQAILSLVVGLAAFIAYVLIGLPYTLVLAIIAGIMEMVPVFGPALGAIPALLVALSVEPGKAIWVLVATGVIQMMENIWLVPRIMKSSMGVNPILILLSLITFSSVFGFPGALLALPLAAIIQLILERTIRSTNGSSDQDSQPLVLEIPTLLQKSQALNQAITEASFSSNPTLPKAPENIREEIISIAQDLNRLLNEINIEEKEQ